MITISIDCNSIHKDKGEIYLSEAEAKFFNLEDGMEVIAYESTDVWNAVVHKFISSKGCEEWYVELRSLKETLDEKTGEWISISGLNGIWAGEEREKYRIAQRMIDLGYGFDEIDKIVDMYDIMKEQVKKIAESNASGDSNSNIKAAYLYVFRRSDMYKIIMIDANSIIEENGEIYLSEEKASYFKLEDGMSIEAYMDDQIFQATVHKFTSSDGTYLWYVKLGEEKDGLTDEQYKWEQIGFDNGFCLGHSFAQRGIIQRMLRMGYDLETIEKIIPMNDEVRSKCKKIIDRQ